MMIGAQNPVDQVEYSWNASGFTLLFLSTTTTTGDRHGFNTSFVRKKVGRGGGRGGVLNLVFSVFAKNKKTGVVRDGPFTDP